MKVLQSTDSVSGARAALLCLAVLALPLSGAPFACSDSASEAKEHEAMEALWSLKFDDVKLEKSSDKQIIAEGDCKTGTIAGLHVDLCLYKDALSADAAREFGLERVGSNTGAALVRERFLLVVADREKVDVHGRALNEVAKLFLDPVPGS